MTQEEELLQFTDRLVRSIVDHPELVRVTVDGNIGDRLRLCAQVEADDMGQVIGKDGRNIQAIRDLLKSCAAKLGTRVEFDLAEPKIRPADETLSAPPSRRSGAVRSKFPL